MLTFYLRHFADLVSGQTAHVGQSCQWSPFPDPGKFIVSTFYEVGLTSMLCEFEKE